MHARMHRLLQDPRCRVKRYLVGTSLYHARAVAERVFVSGRAFATDDAQESEFQRDLTDANQLQAYASPRHDIVGRWSSCRSSPRRIVDEIRSTGNVLCSF